MGEETFITLLFVVEEVLDEDIDAELHACFPLGLPLITVLEMLGLEAGVSLFILFPLLTTVVGFKDRLTSKFELLSLLLSSLKLLTAPVKGKGAVLEETTTETVLSILW